MSSSAQVRWSARGDPRASRAARRRAAVTVVAFLRVGRPPISTGPAPFAKEAAGEIVCLQPTAANELSGAGVGHRRSTSEKLLSDDTTRGANACVSGGPRSRTEAWVIQDRRSVGVMGWCSCARTPGLLLAIASSATVCAAQERYEWQCTEAQQAAPCMSDVACPIEGINKAMCQRLCEEALGCASIVHESSGGRCYLKEERSGDGLGAESCVRTLQVHGGEAGEDGQERWSTACVLWGAGCTPASPLPWLMALFFGM